MTKFVMCSPTVFHSPNFVLNRKLTTISSFFLIGFLILLLNNNNNNNTRELGFQWPVC
jgi:hypothetical protein